MDEVNRPPVVAVLGPTAVGKSRVGIGLAMSLGGEIICADSRQLYRRIDLGTDKVPQEKQGGIPHHLQDSVDPDVPVSAGVFSRMADEALAGIRRRGAVPLLVGGSGLYVEAFLGGLFQGPQRDEGLRDRLKRSWQRHGEHWLHRMLRRLDPVTAGRLAVRDRQRIVRALEVRLITGRPLSSHLGEEPDRTRRDRVPHLRIGLTMERKRLVGRIEERVDQMFQAGLVEEVRRLLDQGLDPASPAMSAIGYREVALALGGGLDGGEDEARELIKRNTRRLAKRQMTWLRHHGSITWFERESDAETVKKIEQHLTGLLQ